MTIDVKNETTAFTNSPICQSESSSKFDVWIECAKQKQVEIDKLKQQLSDLTPTVDPNAKTLDELFNKAESFTIRNDENELCRCGYDADDDIYWFDQGFEAYYSFPADTPVSIVDGLLTLVDEDDDSHSNLIHYH